MTAKRANIIVGCTLHSLYAGIKSLELGYSTTILEKNSCGYVKKKRFDNCKIFSHNHTAYIQILDTFNIEYNSIKNPLECLTTFLEHIVQEMEDIPKDTMICNSFEDICVNVLSKYDLSILMSYNHIFGDYLSTINALDFVSIIKRDFTCRTRYFYIDDDKLALLHSRMLSLFVASGGNIIYDNEVKTIKHSKKFILVTNTFYVYNCDILMLALSKNNMLSFNWNHEQNTLLNYISTIHVPNRIFEKGIDEAMTLDAILNDLHIVFPQISNERMHTHIWTKGCCSELFGEKLKGTFNKRMHICGQSYSKNSAFVNYSLECVDECIARM